MTSATTFGAFNLAMWMGGCEGCQKQIANRPMRRNIANLPANDPVIQAFKAGVQAMKALPTSDKRNWNVQADIHFNNCPHQNWWWLPWHRAYLLYFERIIRKLSGYADFALPYWNWTTSPSVPAEFWGSGNPLFDGTRGVGPSDTADPSWVGATVIGDILNITNFYNFASYPATSQRQRTTFGMLESTPHNNIHPWVNGDMSGFHSPLDPVFWCHHNMLDCLWNEWNVNRGNANTNDSNWALHHFTEFVDENGTAVDITPAVANLFPIFSYQFEPCGPSHTGSKMSARALEQFLRAGAPVKLEFLWRTQLQRSIVTEVGTPVRSAAKLEPDQIRRLLETNGNEALLLTVEGVEVPDKTDYFVRVFLNKPDVSAETPITDARFAGSFGFFNDAKAMASMPGMSASEKLGFVVDITASLRRLNQGGALSGNQVDITLVPVAYERREAAGQRLTIQSLELGIAQVR